MLPCLHHDPPLRCLMLKRMCEAPRRLSTFEAPAQVPPLPTGCSGVALRLTVGASVWAYSPPPPTPTRNIFSCVCVCEGGGARAANTLRGRLCSLHPWLPKHSQVGRRGRPTATPFASACLLTLLALLGCDFWAGTVVIALIKTSGSRFTSRVC